MTNENSLIDFTQLRNILSVLKENYIVLNLFLKTRIKLISNTYFGNVGVTFLDFSWSKRIYPTTYSRIKSNTCRENLKTWRRLQRNSVAVCIKMFTTIIHWGMLQKKLKIYIFNQSFYKTHYIKTRHSYRKLCTQNEKHSTKFLHKATTRMLNEVNNPVTWNWSRSNWNPTVSWPVLDL